MTGVFGDLLESVAHGAGVDVHPLGGSGDVEVGVGAGCCSWRRWSAWLPLATPTGRSSLSREERLAGDFGKRFGRLVVVKALAEHRTGIHAAVRNGLENLRQ